MDVDGTTDERWVKISWQENGVEEQGYIKRSSLRKISDKRVEDVPINEAKSSIAIGIRSANVSQPMREFESENITYEISEVEGSGQSFELIYSSYWQPKWSYSIGLGQRTLDLDSSFKVRQALNSDAMNLKQQGLSLFGSLQRHFDWGFVFGTGLEFITVQTSEIIIQNSEENPSTSPNYLLLSGSLGWQKSWNRFLVGIYLIPGFGLNTDPTLVMNDVHIRLGWEL